jgi:hypothetical protein
MTTRTDQAQAGQSQAGSTMLTKLAWGILLAVSMLGTLNHAVGAFAFTGPDAGPLMFACFAGINLYATAVLLWPYRRGELWAWAVTWVQVVAFALVYPLIDDPGLGMGYLVVAIIAALAQLASLPLFRSARVSQ